MILNVGSYFEGWYLHIHLLYREIHLHGFIVSFYRLGKRIGVFMYSSINILFLSQSKKNAYFNIYKFGFPYIVK